jgi:hypothetical protein
MAGVPGAQVTYASLMGDLEEFHAGFEGGLDVARRWLDGTHGVLVDGEERFRRHANVLRSKPVPDGSVPAGREWTWPVGR